MTSDRAVATLLTRTMGESGRETPLERRVRGRDPRSSGGEHPPRRRDRRVRGSPPVERVAEANWNVRERYQAMNGRYRELITFVGLAMTWGSGFVAIKVGLAYYPPVLYAALRNGLAAAVIFGCALLTADRLRPRGWREWVTTAVSGVLVVGASQGFLFLGQQTTTSGVAAVLTGLIPVLTAGFARVVPSGNGIDRREFIGLVVGAAGTVVVAGAPSSVGSGGLAGRLFVLLGASCFALGSVVTQRRTDSVPLETHQAWALGIGSVLIYGVSTLLGESAASIRWTHEAIGALIYLIVVPSAVGFFLYFKLLDWSSPVKANLVMNVSPIFAAIAGWLVLSEHIGSVTVVGFLVIGVGWTLAGGS